MTELLIAPAREIGCADLESLSEVNADLLYNCKILYAQCLKHCLSVN